MSRDLLESSKALLALDADGALVPHGLGGHGRTCLTWCVEEVERLRSALRDLRLTSRVLLENAHGCAMNHHGEDYLHGPPGWLADCENSIVSAEKALSTETGN